ncbi:MAG: DNA-binding protein [Alloprevotella sp.]|nr:DNA-binding protein [Alloprevotella sp.]
MSVIYDVIPRKSPKDKSVRYYASVNTIEKVGQHEVAELIADETTLNAKEAEMALAQLGKILKRLLQDGRSVELGDWASFHLTVNSNGSSTAKECTAANIKKVNVQCRFADKFREEMQHTKFVPATKFDKEAKAKRRGKATD